MRTTSILPAMMTALLMLVLSASAVAAAPGPEPIVVVAVARRREHLHGRSGAHRATGNCHCAARHHPYRSRRSPGAATGRNDGVHCERHARRAARDGQRGRPHRAREPAQRKRVYDVAKRPGRKLRIETPYLVAVVKGTRFNVLGPGRGRHDFAVRGPPRDLDARRQRRRAAERRRDRRRADARMSASACSAWTTGDAIRVRNAAPADADGSRSAAPRRAMRPGAEPASGHAHRR